MQNFTAGVCKVRVEEVGGPLLEAVKKILKKRFPSPPLEEGIIWCDAGEALCLPCVTRSDQHEVYYTYQLPQPETSDEVVFEMEGQSLSVLSAVNETAFKLSETPDRREVNKLSQAVEMRAHPVAGREGKLTCLEMDRKVYIAWAPKPFHAILKKRLAELQKLEEGMLRLQRMVAQHGFEWLKSHYPCREPVLSNGCLLIQLAWVGVGQAPPTLTVRVSDKGKVVKA